jgi:hypothetical protein
MWSLPDITRLNANAAAKAKKLKREAASKRKPNCEFWKCSQQATRSYLVYDIFSDDPKDILHLCEQHDGFSGEPCEGYFTCNGCGRVMVENYTWEIYHVEMDGESLCLRCAADRHFSNTRNWIDPKLVKKVVLAPYEPTLNGQNVLLFDTATGVLNLARCKHVLGVQQPLPEGIKFVENFEFDSLDGHQISGGDVLETIHALNEPFCPVLDAGYQFAVSIGLYVRRWPAEKPFKGLFTKAGDSRALPITLCFSGSTLGRVTERAQGFARFQNSTLFNCVDRSLDGNGWRTIYIQRQSAEFFEP